MTSKNVSKMLGWLGVFKRSNHYKNALDFINHGEECELLRDIVGNPFKEIILKNGKMYIKHDDGHLDVTKINWINDEVLSLAHAAHESGVKLERDRLLVLSDALEENGCDCELILNHLRSDKKHFKGMWSLNLFVDYINN